MFVAAAPQSDQQGRAVRGARRAGARPSRRRARPHRQRGELRRARLARAAGDQLVRLLFLRRHRARRRSVPGQAGLRAHRARQGRLRHRRGDARNAGRRGRARVSGPHRLRRRIALGNRRAAVRGASVCSACGTSTVPKSRASTTKIASACNVCARYSWSRCAADARWGRMR